jgi:hypothetical protein
LVRNSCVAALSQNDRFIGFIDDECVVESFFSAELLLQRFRLRLSRKIPDPNAIPDPAFDFRFADECIVAGCFQTFDGDICVASIESGPIGPGFFRSSEDPGRSVGVIARASTGAASDDWSSVDRESDGTAAERSADCFAMASLCGAAPVSGSGKLRRNDYRIVRRGKQSLRGLSRRWMKSARALVLHGTKKRCHRQRRRVIEYRPILADQKTCARVAQLRRAAFEGKSSGGKTAHAKFLFRRELKQGRPDVVRSADQKLVSEIIDAVDARRRWSARRDRGFVKLVIVTIR